jgi:Alkylmercury lyase
MSILAAGTAVRASNSSWLADTRPLQLKRSCYRSRSAPNVFDQFCTYANMFCDTAHLQAWQEASGLLGRALDLAGAAALGRDSWAEFARTDPSL